MEYETLTSYDRTRITVNGLFTRPATIKGKGLGCTYVVETCRAVDLDENGIDRGGDYIFIECVEGSSVSRMALPPRVADAIASQRERLTARRRSMTGKRLARERMARGERPAFLK